MKFSHSTTVSSLVWKLPSQLHETQAETIEQLGYQHKFFRYDEPVPAGTDIVFIQGPYGSLRPFVGSLLRIPREQRPVVIYWFQQSLDLAQSTWVSDVSTRVFSDIYRQYLAPKPVGRPLEGLVNRYFPNRGARLGFLGDIQALHRLKLLDVLALSSTVYARLLRGIGIDSVVVPRGYHPGYGRRLNLERDLAAVWMGKLRTAKRRQAIHWIREELKKRGLNMQIFDGVENQFIYGEERTQILNRAWFVLNVFFSGPADELSIRFFVAGANGAVVMTERGLNDYPFRPGKQIVECPVEEMPNTIEHYLNHPDQWRAISESMFELIQKKLTLEASIGNLLERAEALREARGIRREETVEARELV
jgi:hypothetical protein